MDNSNLKYRIKQFIWFINGKTDTFTIEQRLFNAANFYIGIILLIFSIANIFLNLLVLAKTTFFLGSFIYFLIHYLAKKGRYFNALVWFFTFYSILLASLIWINNGGTNGPGNYSFFVLFAVILFIFKGYQRLISFSLIVLNVALLYIFEIKFPEYIYVYPNTTIRAIDHLISFSATLVMLYVVLRFTKKNYLFEKNRAEENDNLKTKFLTNLSHEIRTPMNGIVGFSQLLKSKDLAEDKREQFIETIISSSSQLLNLIEDIVDISKIESNQVEIYETKFSLNDLLKELYIFFKDKAEAKNLRLIVTQNKEINLFTDKTKLYQIISNLLDNAIKFTDEGSIKFGFEIRANFLMFFVKDSGIGINVGNEKIIFERFRKDTNDDVRIYGGTGLGLSIAKSFTQLLNGEMWVENNEDKGCTFYFTIPDNKIDSTIKNENNSEKDTTLNLKGKLILVAEDEYSNYLLLSELLQETNARIIHAKNGNEAIELTKKKIPDCILMDIKMPELDGFEATKIIKSSFPAIPIIAQTAYALKGDEEKALTIGCNDYIAKPILKEILFEKLAAYLLN